MIRHDYHIHTVLSGHAAPDMTVRAVLVRAAALGLERIVILEHVPRIPAEQELVTPGPRRALPRAQIDHIAAEVRKHRNWVPLEVLVGAEIDADPYRMDGSLLLQDLTDVDVVLASTHYLPSLDAFWFAPPELTAEERGRVYAEWFTWAKRIAANPQVHILAHPGVEMHNLGAFQRFKGLVLEDMTELLRVCKAHNTAFELNELFAVKVGAEAAESYIEVIARARDLGVPLAIGSDSHKLENIGRFPWVQSVIKRLGLGPAHFFHPAP